MGSCSGKCEDLSTATGTADTTTSQSIGLTLGKYKMEPDVGSTTATGTPSVATPSGYAWQLSASLGGVTILSGPWTFDLTTSLGVGVPLGTATVWITVWNCQTSSEGSCSFLFKNWDNSTNVLSSLGATKRTYNTATIGPFNNIDFLVVEYWLSYTSAGVSLQGVTETTGSSASDVIFPNVLTTSAPADTYSTSDGLIIGSEKVVTDSFHLSDAVVRGISTGAADSFNLNDALLRGVAKVLSDSYSSSDSIGVNLKETRGVPDSYPFSDSVLKGIAASSADSFVFLDTSLHGIARAVGDAYVLTEGTLSGAGKVVSDTLLFSESPAQNAFFTRSASESYVFSDSILKSMVKAIDDSFAAIDSTHTGLGRVPTDSFGFVDLPARAAGLVRELSEAVAFSDSTIVGRAIFAGIQDSYSFFDGSLSKSLFSRSVSENFAFSDSTIHGVSATVADVFPFLSTAPPTIVSQVLSDGVAFADRAARDWLENVADTLLLSDSLLRASGESVTDASSFVESSTRTVFSSRVLGDMVGFLELPISGAVRLPSFHTVVSFVSDSFPFADSSFHGIGLKVSETISFLDAIMSLTLRQRSLSDVFQFSAGLTKGFTTEANDTFAFGFAVGKVITNGVNDSLSVSESTIASVGHSLLGGITILSLFGGLLAVVLVLVVYWKSQERSRRKPTKWNDALQ